MPLQPDADGRGAALRAAACSRAAGGELLRRLIAGVAQARERVALRLVRADRLIDRIERPVLELGRLRGTAARELFDCRAEGAAAAAAQRGVSRLGRARHILALARAALLARAAPLVAAAAIIITGAPAVVAAAVFAVL